MEECTNKNGSKVLQEPFGLEKLEEESPGVPESLREAGESSK